MTGILLRTDQSQSCIVNCTHLTQEDRFQIDALYHRHWVKWYGAYYSLSSYSVRRLDDHFFYICTALT